MGPRTLDVALTWLELYCFDPDDEALRVKIAPLRRSFFATSWKR